MTQGQTATTDGGIAMTQVTIAEAQQRLPELKKSME